MVPYMKLAAITCILFLLSGCASMLSDDKYIVEIKSHPLGADFSVTDTRGNLIHEGVTPEIIALYSGAGYFDHAQYKVLFSKEGYFQEIRELKSTVDEMYFANFSNVLGFFAIDPAGAMYELPDSVHAFLKEMPKPAKLPEPAAVHVHYNRPVYRRPVVTVRPVVPVQPQVYAPPVYVQPAPAPSPAPYVQPAPAPQVHATAPATIEQIVTPLSERVTTHTTEQVDTIQHSETHFEPCTKESQPCN